MKIDFCNVLTGEIEEDKEFNYKEINLFSDKGIQCLITEVMVEGYRFIDGFGWDEEVEYDINEVLQFFRFINDYVSLTIMGKRYIEINDFVEQAKEKLSHNKWGYTIDDLEIFAQHYE